MAAVINTNVQSLNAQRNLSSSQNALGTSLTRLSSGLRINSAKDDAAGLAISERMTAQLRGINQAIRNANDATSLLQTAEGAISTVGDSLQRIRELAVQSANATNSASDRQALQTEAAQLIGEITRIGTQTTFNGERIFDQSTSSIGGDPTQRAVLNGLQLGWLGNAEKMIEDSFGLLGRGEKMYIGINQFSDGAGQVLAYVSYPSTKDGHFQDMQLDLADFTPPNLPNGASAPDYADRTIAHEMVHAVMNSAFGVDRTSAMPLWFLEGAAEFIQGSDERLANDIARAQHAADLADDSTLNSSVDDDAGLTAVLNRAAATWGTGYTDPGTDIGTDYSAAYIAARKLHDTLKGHGHADGIKALMTHIAETPGATLDSALNTLTQGEFADADAFIASFTGANVAAGIDYVKTRIDFDNADTGAIGGLDADGGPVKTAESVVPFGSPDGRGYDPQNTLRGFRLTFDDVGGAGTTGSHQLQFQIGANAGETLQTRIGSINAESLGIQDLDLSTSVGATVALGHVDEALDYLNLQRANIGAQLNRLEFTVANLHNSAENLSAARSRIRDTDFAQETAKLTRAQILQQAGTAMLAQANALPNQVLSLLS